MSPGATFERVYHALKEQLSSGRFAAGEHLEPALLSDDLNASVTPVRDALHRLVGEGLVEAPRSDGFRTPYMTELRLRHLYRWNGSLLDLAARSRGFHPGALEPRLDDVLASTERLFAAIADLPNNPEHAAAIARLSERLRLVRRVELRFLAGVREELEAMAERLAAGEAAELRRAVAAYHRRRERLAPDIVAALQRPD
jgi:DNA-binding FadR family transcriptional regulator